MDVREDFERAMTALQVLDEYLKYDPGYWDETLETAWRELEWAVLARGEWDGVYK